MASNVVNTYDFKDNIIIWGTVAFSGTAEEGVSITQSEDSFVKKRGADGTVERENTGDTDSEITINMLQTNPLNLVLSALHKADKLSNKGALPFTVTDLAGTSSYFSGTAWIKKPADLNLAKTSTPTVWVLDTGPAEMTIGGKDSGASLFS